VAAKRVQPDGGDQDFGFLSSANDAETDSGAVDFGFTESRSPSPAASFEQFSTLADPEETDFDAATADAVAPADSVAPAVNAASKPVSAPAPIPQPQVSAAAATIPAATVAPTPNTPTPVAAPRAAAVKPTATKAPTAAVPKPSKPEMAPTSGTDQESSPAEQPAPVVPETADKKGNGKLSAGLLGYAIALTLLLLGLLLTGRLSLTGNSVLESLPDLRPLAPNEFRKIEEGAELPEGHVLNLGESRRFGDVVVTPVKLTKEPLKFQGFLSGEINEKLTTQPVLKLWLNFESVADDYAYPPFDSGLMSNRTPPYSTDSTTLANSFLTIFVPSQDSATTRKLNYLHTLDNNFVIVDQNSAKVLQPGESMLSFIAASETDNDVATDETTQFVWRIQFRKGVHVSSGNGVTTLIDVKFSGADIDKAG
jgi:hypothetical protein